MRSATDQEARTYCNQEEGARKVADDDSIYFESYDEHCFFIHSPSDYRSLGYLCQYLVTWVYSGQFAGGLIWLRRWDVGADYLTPVGWKVIENLRRANGDTRSLDVAPAQFFSGDEAVDAQVFLMTVLGNGWPACFVPDSADFIVEFRSTHRLFFCCDSEATRDRLMVDLEEFAPHLDETAEAQ